MPFWTLREKNKSLLTNPSIHLTSWASLGAAAQLPSLRGGGEALCHARELQQRVRRTARSSDPRFASARAQAPASGSGGGLVGDSFCLDFWLLGRTVVMGLGFWEFLQVTIPRILKAGCFFEQNNMVVLVFVCCLVVIVHLCFERNSRLIYQSYLHLSSRC